MRFIGITGGIGAGKSEILGYIGKHYKCEIYMADQVAHDVKEPGQPCYEQLVKLFNHSKGILGPDGRIDRIAMAARIFVDKDLLKKVNELVHPAVQDYLMEKLEQAGRNPEVELFFVEAALLIETGYKDIVDELWYVHADEELRKKRLIKERGYPPERIQQIMKQQLSEELFRKECDFIIENSGTLEESYRQIDRKLEAFTWQE